MASCLQTQTSRQMTLSETSHVRWVKQDKIKAGCNYSELRRQHKIICCIMFYCCPPLNTSKKIEEEFQSWSLVKIIFTLKFQDLQFSADAQGLFSSINKKKVEVKKLRKFSGPGVKMPLNLKKEFSVLKH